MQSFFRDLVRLGLFVVCLLCGGLRVQAQCAADPDCKCCAGGRCVSPDNCSTEFKPVVTIVAVCLGTAAFVVMIFIICWLKRRALKEPGTLAAGRDVPGVPLAVVPANTPVTDASVVTPPPSNRKPGTEVPDEEAAIDLADGVFGPLVDTLGPASGASTPRTIHWW
eukprot:EG_transcript_21100